MRTTLNIDDVLMEKLLQTTHEKSKTLAGTVAIEDYLHKKSSKKSYTTRATRHRR